MIENVQTYLNNYIALPWLSSAIFYLFGLSLLALFGYVISLIAKYTLRKVAIKIVKRTRLKWDNLLIENKVLDYAIHALNLVLLNLISKQYFSMFSDLHSFNTVVLNLLLVVTITLLISAIIDFIEDLWGKTSLSEKFSAKGLIQAAKLLLYSFGAIFFLSILIGKSPLYFLSGIGALTAVLLLVFKDPLMGLIAGIQVSTNDLIRIGDWIEMPSHDANGTVKDISLTTLKVENWNQTISSIPMQSLITNSYKNWRNMSGSGGRRIKRSIIIDTNSLGFLDDNLSKKLESIPLIKDYITEKLKEIGDYNSSNSKKLKIQRRLTNIGIFRKYCLEYLKNNPQINSDMTLIVRQLEPTGIGIPLEIWTYSNTTDWVAYEGIQSDVFDHLFSILKTFNLRAYQRPNGRDFNFAIEQDIKIDQ